MAKEMHADAAEEARKTKRSHGDEVYTKLALDQINESGLTNILNLALPDTRNLTEVGGRRPRSWRCTVSTPQLVAQR